MSKLSPEYEDNVQNPSPYALVLCNRAVKLCWEDARHRPIINNDPIPVEKIEGAIVPRTCILSFGYLGSS